jgi:hypothetical protein
MDELQTEINNDLFNAIQRMDLHDVHEAMRFGADLTAVNECGQTPKEYNAHLMEQRKISTIAVGNHKNIEALLFSAGI